SLSLVVWGSLGEKATIATAATIQTPMTTQRKPTTMRPRIPKGLRSSPTPAPLGGGAPVELTAGCTDLSCWSTTVDRRSRIAESTVYAYNGITRGATTGARASAGPPGFSTAGGGDLTEGRAR